MEKFKELICWFFLALIAFVFFMLGLFIADQNNKGVTPILKLYNDAVVQCKDEACRQYMTTFYIRVLRDLTSEVKK